MASHGGVGIKKETPTWKKMLLSWTTPGTEYLDKFLAGWGFDSIIVMPFIVLLVVITAYQVDPVAIEATFAVLTATSPIWLPFVLIIVFWHQWIHYIRFMFWFPIFNDSILLEVQLPAEVEKSPAAMEIFFTTLWQTGGETTFIHRIWRGAMRAVFSLEIASNHGQVRFYIHTRRAWRSLLESRLYGQYPEAKIFEVDDYVKKIPFNLEEYDIFGAEYKKDNPYALPIKTYVDFNLDKNPDKPENQTDPITHVVEALGQIGPDEHYWMQIIIRGRKVSQGEEWYGFYIGDRKFGPPATEEIKKITQGAVKRAQDLIDSGDPAEDKKQKAQAASRGAGLMTETERRRVEAIERSRGKLLFDVGIRVVYLAKKERYVGINNGNVIRFFDVFRSSGLTNGLGVTRGTSYFDYPWQFEPQRKPIEQKNLFFRYRYRAYFGVPYDQDYNVMTTEELATLWHFPSSVVRTPALDRVPAKVSEAPLNLPIADILPH